MTTLLWTAIVCLTNLGIGDPGHARESGLLTSTPGHPCPPHPTCEPAWLTEHDSFAQRTWRIFRDAGFYIEGERAFHQLKTHAYLFYVQDARIQNPDATDQDVGLAILDAVNQTIRLYALREQGVELTIRDATAMRPPEETTNAFLKVVYRSCYDGDTCRFDLPGIHPLFGENIPVRLAGVDTPEIRGRCAKEKRLALDARDRVRKLLADAQRIDLRDVARGKYFRIVARIEVDGIDLAEFLIDRDLAVRYDGGTKEKDWCE